MIMEAPLGTALDTLTEELDAGAKAIQKSRVHRHPSAPMVNRNAAQVLTASSWHTKSWTASPGRSLTLAHDVATSIARKSPEAQTRLRTLWRPVGTVVPQLSRLRNAQRIVLPRTPPSGTGPDTFCVARPAGGRHGDCAEEELLLALTRRTLQ